MITMTVRPLPITGSAAVKGGHQHDEATCEWDGRAFRATSAHGATMALARLLVAAGCPDQPWETFAAQGTRSLRGRSLHWLAGRTLSEGDRKGLRMVPYEPAQDRGHAGAGEDTGRFPVVEPVVE